MISYLIYFIKSLREELTGEYMKDIKKTEDLLKMSDSDFEFLFSNKKDFAKLLIENDILDVKAFNDLIKSENLVELKK